MKENEKPRLTRMLHVEYTQGDESRETHSPFFSKLDDSPKEYIIVHRRALPCCAGVEDEVWPLRELRITPMRHKNDLFFMN
jgi:hypothetical protein